MLCDPAMGLLLGGAVPREPAGGAVVGGTWLRDPAGGFDVLGPPQRYGGMLPMTSKGGGLFLVRSVVDSAGGMYGGQKSSASGGGGEFVVTLGVLYGEGGHWGALRCVCIGAIHSLYYVVSALFNASMYWCIQWRPTMRTFKLLS